MYSALSQIVLLRVVLCRKLPITTQSIADLFLSFFSSVVVSYRFSCSNYTVKLETFKLH